MDILSNTFVILSVDSFILFMKIANLTKEVVVQYLVRARGKAPNRSVFSSIGALDALSSIVELFVKQNKQFNRLFEKYSM